MDARIDRLFRKDAALLRKAAANGATLDELHATKQKMLGDFYNILSVCLGEPPIKFDFELKVGKNCKADAKKLSPIEPSEKTDDADSAKESHKKNAADKKGETDEKDEKGSQILRDFGITPLQFVERYCNVNPDKRSKETIKILKELGVVGFVSTKKGTNSMKPKRKEAEEYARPLPY